MAFRNTSERYEYIFGSNARKLDREEDFRRDYGSEVRSSRNVEIQEKSAVKKDAKKAGKKTTKKTVVKAGKKTAKKTMKKKAFFFRRTGSKKKVRGTAKPAVKRELSPFEQKVVAHNLERMRAFDWKYTLIILLAVFMVVSGSMIYVHETAVIKAKEQQVYDLKEKKEDLLGKQSALKGQIDKSIDLKAIKSYASKKLNMTMPDKKHTLYYSGGSGSYFYQFESVSAGK